MYQNRVFASSICPIFVCQYPLFQFEAGLAIGVNSLGNGTITRGKLEDGEKGNGPDRCLPRGSDLGSSAESVSLESRNPFTQRDPIAFLTKINCMALSEDFNSGVASPS